MNGQKVLCKVWSKEKSWSQEYTEEATLIQFNCQPDNDTMALVMLPNGLLAEYPYQCIRIVVAV